MPVIAGIQDEILRLHAMGLLDRLLEDKTTRAHILWATDAYEDRGAEYRRDREITAALITGKHGNINNVGSQNVIIWSIIFLN